MKKITALLIGCLLAFAGVVIAQQPETQESPSKKGARPEETTRPTKERPTRNAPGEAKPTRNATKMESATPETGMKQRGAKGERGAKTTTNAEASPAGASPAQEGAAGKKGRRANRAETSPAAGMSPGATEAEQGRKGRKGREAKAPTAASPAASAAASATPAAAATAAAGAAGAGAGATQGTVGRGGKRVEAQQVQQIKQQHATFRAQPKPNVAPTVTFDANRRIQGAEQWQGPQYEVFRVYHPEWHDQGWYRSHFGRVELIGGGWYYWNNGYWFPAWGYDTSVAYYPYDGPIYVGRTAEPPDKVIADVQAELQAMGYYTGEVDGLLGPLTRQALRDYQSEHGLAVTEAIDEPTLDSLQLS